MTPTPISKPTPTQTMTPTATRMTTPTMITTKPTTLTMTPTMTMTTPTTKKPTPDLHEEERAALCQSSAEVLSGLDELDALINAEMESVRHMQVLVFHSFIHSFIHSLMYS